mgnify:CR=1 FL=1
MLPENLFELDFDALIKLNIGHKLLKRSCVWTYPGTVLLNPTVVIIHYNQSKKLMATCELMTLGLVLLVQSVSKGMANNHLNSWQLMINQYWSITQT